MRILRGGGYRSAPPGSKSAHLEAASDDAKPVSVG